MHQNEKAASENCSLEVTPSFVKEDGGLAEGKNHSVLKRYRFMGPISPDSGCGIASMGLSQRGANTSPSPTIGPNQHCFY